MTTRFNRSRLSPARSRSVPCARGRLLERAGSDDTEEPGGTDTSQVSKDSAAKISSNIARGARNVGLERKVRLAVEAGTFEDVQVTGPQGIGHRGRALRRQDEVDLHHQPAAGTRCTGPRCALVVAVGHAVGERFADAVGVAFDADQQGQAAAGQRDQPGGRLAWVHAQAGGDLVHSRTPHLRDQGEQTGIGGIRRYHASTLPRVCDLRVSGCPQRFPSCGPGVCKYYQLLINQHFSTEPFPS